MGSAERPVACCVATASSRAPMRTGRGRLSCRHLTPWALALLLAACASEPTGTPDNEPTLAALALRPAPPEFPVAPGPSIAASPAQAAAAYKRFLDMAPNAAQRGRAMRRLGDLEMERAENQAAAADTRSEYRAAIARYQDYLKTYPEHPDNDQVLYQMARAHELNGQGKAALAALDRLVSAHPTSVLRDEVHFRRGELLFNSGQFAQAEQAYNRLIQPDTPSVPPPRGLIPLHLPSDFYERALYMHGWSLYKQRKIGEALHSFFDLLDLKIAGQDEAALDKLPGLSHADREMVDDTLHVASLSLSSLGGAEAIADYINNDKRRSYEFRIYEQLGALYIKQDRPKDAADTFAAFVRQRPQHAQAPMMQTRVIDIFERSGLPTLALGARTTYVERYGVNSDYRRSHRAAWESTVQPLVKSHLAALASHHHAKAQKTKVAADVDAAARWYRESLVSFPSGDQAASHQFLLAELLYEDGRFAEAAVEYDKAAYDHPRHAKSADAAYTALLAHAQLEKRAAGADLPGLQRAGVIRAERFGAQFGGDPRVAPVLTQAAEKLFVLRDVEYTGRVAQQVLSISPAAAPELRRVAWTLAAHAAFEARSFQRAEQGYDQALALTSTDDAGRKDLIERQAASIYKQGEQARAAGLAREAVAHFERVAPVAPLSSLHAAAQYDAAATLIGLQDWDAAARHLEAFRRDFPKHRLLGEAGEKLAAIYLELQRWADAATEFERMAATNSNPLQSRDALWQAAELHDKAGVRADAMRVYSAYAQRHPEPFERQIEARWRVVMSLQAGQKTPASSAREIALLREIRDADQRASKARTARTRTIGGLAALALVEPLLDDYRKVALVEPLARQLKLKKARMEAVLSAYAQASESAIAEVVTAATFQTAALYQDFGRAMLQSQRPTHLQGAALEQYNVLLEEQAFPFEEKAIALHETNARRATTGLYDDWVRKSFDALRELQPVRYGKSERHEDGRDQPTQTQRHNELGIAYRLSGEFTLAREAYERAIALNANNAAALLNLGILHDLYLGNGTLALEFYERYLLAIPGDDATVTKWIADLRRRQPAPQPALTGQAARSGQETP